MIIMIIMIIIIIAYILYIYIYITQFAEAPASPDVGEGPRPSARRW